MSSPKTDQELTQKLIELALLFLRLGFTAFGGPAAHVALLHNEVVNRRKWLDDQQFLDLLGATNMIPGPNSTEMVIHIGLMRAGWPGLIVAGLSFILPAMLIVMALAWMYVQYGTSPAMEGILYGIKPVIISVICAALWSMGRKAVKGKLVLAVGCAAFLLYFFKVNEIALLFAGGIIVMLGKNGWRVPKSGLQSMFLPFLPMGMPILLQAPFNLSLMFFTFLKIGAVLYGSGYVLLAFLRADFVIRLGWLTDRQLMDAIAIGQVTPGPVFTAATFVGYLLGGVPGALLATLGIFLPAFIFVAVSSPLIPKMRNSPCLGALLDGVIASSLGLMGAVTLELGRAALMDLRTAAIALASIVLLVQFKLNPTWLVVGGAFIGLLPNLLAV